jgi:hypothetical protein
MEVLLEDIKRTLGAQRIYLPGSVEQTQYIAKLAKLQQDVGVGELGERVQGLGIVDSAIDVRQALGSGLPPSAPLPTWSWAGQQPSAENERAVLRSSIMRVKEGRDGGIEMSVK